jgi:hypothetical protein
LSSKILTKDKNSFFETYQHHRRQQGGLCIAGCLAKTKQSIFEKKSGSETIKKNKEQRREGIFCTGTVLNWSVICEGGGE